MRRSLLLAALVAFSFGADAKPVDVATAKKVGFNFLGRQLVESDMRSANELELVYTSQSADGAVKYFYVFNRQSSFVMVSADDQVIPVFGYSGESAFDMNNIPSNMQPWLDAYAGEIKYVIENNVPATNEIREKWHGLSDNSEGSGNKTTATGNFLMTTTWDQAPYVNEQCPFDVSENEHAVTGCVATAMAQIMKYWNWPVKGTGSHTYYHNNFGNLTADFGNTTYDWNNMPDGVNSSATAGAVAKLMYHCGVSVNMNYRTGSQGGSGAYVIDAMSPHPYSAESALRDFFGYSQSLHSVVRASMSTANWINTLKSEIDNSRPVLYAGFGSGGHAWVADGYDNNDFFHINWGWGQKSNGNFSVDAMNPSALGAGGGTGGFNYNQHAIVGIQPPAGAMSAPDAYESNNLETKKFALPVKFNGNTAQIATTGSNFHSTNEIDFYEIFLPIGDNYTVNVRLHDSKNSGNGQTYSLDGRLNVKIPGAVSIWAGPYEDVVPNAFNVKGGGVMGFKISNTSAGAMGDYLLEVNVTRIPTGITDVNSTNNVVVYPNPATDNININLGTVSAAEISIIDLQGRQVSYTKHSGNQLVTLPVSILPNGLYIVRVQSEAGIVTEKISINR